LTFFAIHCKIKSEILFGINKFLLGIPPSQRIISSRIKEEEEERKSETEAADIFHRVNN
jgi:hypothetical protein